MKKNTVSEKKKTLDALYLEIRAACLKVKEFRDEPLVFGQGPAPCALMIVGEAPGREEVRDGRPFTGKAGRFLMAALCEALSLERDEVFITNVVKLWPNIKTQRKKTRKPHEFEEEFFRPYLLREIDAVGPRVIIAVGKTAFSAIAPEDTFAPGRWVEKPGGILVMPVYHPSYLLRRQKSLAASSEELRKALREAGQRARALS